MTLRAAEGVYACVSCWIIHVKNALLDFLWPCCCFKPRGLKILKPYPASDLKHGEQGVRFPQCKRPVIPAFFTFSPHCCRFWSGWRRPCSHQRSTCCPPITPVASATLGRCPSTPVSRKSPWPWVGQRPISRYEVHRVWVLKVLQHVLYYTWD